MNKLVISAATISLLGLAACSGGGSDGGAGVGNDQEASAGESFSDYDDIVDLSEQIDAGNLAAVDTTSRAGTATLTGAIGIGNLSDEENLELIGDLSVDANFDSDTATGSATGFTLFNGDTGDVESDVTGALTMGNGTISGADFDATMAGTLTESGEDFDLDLALDGGFYDDGGELVLGGDVAGTILDGEGVENVEGGFAAVE